MSQPRRSARLAPRPHTHEPSQQPQRSSSSAPTFAQASQSQPSSTSTSSFPSPTNDSDLNTTHHPPSYLHSHPHLQVHSSFMPQHHNSHLHAPLPSPSANEMDPFFGRPHSQPNPYSSHSQQQNPQQAATYNQPQPQQQHIHHNSFSQHTGMAGGQVGQPGAMPQDFLAEAAKRAQMACLMRDLGDVSL